MLTNPCIKDLTREFRTLSLALCNQLTDVDVKDLLQGIRNLNLTWCLLLSGGMHQSLTKKSSKG